MDAAVQMEATTTNKGAPMLLCDGFEYTIKFKGRETLRWCCARRAAYSCKGAVTTTNTEPVS